MYTHTVHTATKIIIRRIIMSCSTLCRKNVSKTQSLLDNTSNFALFSVSGLKDEKFRTKEWTQLKHTHSILQYFEYFCQMSSKSILIISSHTVSISKLEHFLRHSVY